MKYPLISSDSLQFLNPKKLDLSSICDQILTAPHINDELRNAIIKNIDKVIGNQEIQWISKNKKALIVDYIVYRYKFKNFPRQKKLESFPLHLLIEPTSSCNLRCTMCFQVDATFQTKEYLGVMELDLYKSLIDQAVEHGCRALTLASRGEPTLHKQLGEMLQYSKGKFLDLKLNTNATRLTPELSTAILDAGVDILVFSVDSHYKEGYEKIRVGANFETVLKNIKCFGEIKKSKEEYRKTTTRISGVYLGKDQSKEKFLKFWEPLVDDVSFTNVAPRWDTYNNELMHYKKPCELLWERMYVWHNGLCNPCDFDYKSYLKVGDAKKSPLKDIWLGEVYKQHREKHTTNKRCDLTPCDRCNLY